MAYDLRWRATNNIVPYELEARMKIQEIERHWRDQLFALFSDLCLLSASITMTNYAAVQFILP